jgi:cephalosporin-C deacetylase-like acetyl esterase
MREIKGDLCHQLLMENPPRLTYADGVEYKAWKESIREKLIELTGLDKIAKNACPLNVEIEGEVQKDGYKQIRFTFESERGEFVPCYLLVPDTGKEKYPVAITLQGHSSGFHNSIAEPKTEEEVEYATGRGAFAVQAVKRGFVALAIEQRGMGERRPRERHQNAAHMCEYTAHIATLLGRTVLGERIWDVSKALDVVSEFLSDKLDLDKILITGNSGGGTISYYATCYDDRIKYAVPSCSFCSFKSSILNIEHCACNYVPNLYKYFEMEDFSSLIAPRPLTIITGEVDDIFPLDGVKESFEVAKKIYSKAGAPNNINMVITPKGHWWCEDIVWDTITKKVKELGW